MSFSAKAFLPFRLKLLLAILAAAAAGTWLTYAAFKSALKPLSEEAAGGLLLSRLELRGTVIDAEIKASVEKARLTAARTGLRELLEKHNLFGPAADKPAIKRRLQDAAAADPSLTGLDLAGTDGKIAASVNGAQPPAPVSPATGYRSGMAARHISSPRAEKGDLTWEVTVPVEAPSGAGVTIGALRCRFRWQAFGRQPGKPGDDPAITLALAAKGGQKLIIARGGELKEVPVRSPEGAPFMAALTGKTGVEFGEGSATGREIYAWRPLESTDWVIAARTPVAPFSAGSDKLLAKARLRAMLGFLFLAMTAFLVAGALASRLAEAGRQAGELLEQCGKPYSNGDLCEPERLSEAIAEASSILKQQASKDLALEAEAEKLREEEADLKSQNDELEKLNKYLMEREIKISELKQEIAELREKVGDGARE